MKFEDKIICKKTQLKVHETINDQTKNKLICIWIWIVIWNENSFNILHQFIMIFEEQLNQIDRQVSSSQLMIVENEENSYFVNSIDDMKWNTKFTQFELLIKWEEYE